MSISVKSSNLATKLSGVFEIDYLVGRMIQRVRLVQAQIQNGKLSENFHVFNQVQIIALFHEPNLQS